MEIKAPAAYATAVRSPIAHRLDGYHFTAEPCDSLARARRQWWDVCERPEQDICLEDGEFQLSGPHGCRRIARFTGRWRMVNSYRYVPTIEVFDVDTVVVMVGDLPVIVGRRGERLKGTWWTHSNAVNHDVVTLK
jgi:hypothetical protein